MKRVKVDPVTGEDMVDPMTGEDLFEDDGAPEPTGRNIESLIRGTPPPERYKSNLFPNAQNIEGSGALRSAGRVGMGVIDVLDAPTRAAATMRGQEMSDPDAYFFRPEAKKAVEKQKVQADEYDRSAQPGLTPDQHFSQMQNRGISTARPGLIEASHRAISDPLLPLSIGGKALGMISKTAYTALAKAIPGFNKMVGGLAEEFSGVSQEALRRAGTKEGRAALEAAAGTQRQIGDDLLERIDNYDEYLPERKQVDEALERMPPISVEGAARTLEGAKSQANAGRTFGYQRAANDKIQGFADDLRGGKQPENLGDAASDARRRYEDAQAESAVTETIAKADERLAAKAQREQKGFQSEVGKLGAEAKNRKKHGTDFGWWHAETLQKAKEAAGKAKEAAINARAQLAVGEISKADFAAAQAAEAGADKAAIVADAADRLFNGENLKAVAGALAKERGLSAADLRDVLAKARSKAESVPDLPDPNVPAKEYRNLRRNLDVTIDFDSEDGKLVNEALKKGRTTMKDELIKAARESGNPEYEKQMVAWSDKLDKLDGLKKYIGKTDQAREKRIESFVSNLFGKNSAHKQQLMEDMDKIFGTEMVEKAKTAQLAGQFGEDGKAGLMPRQFTGRSALGAVAGIGTGLVTGNPFLSILAPFLLASPKVASRVTLPRLDDFEKLARKAGKAFSPKAKKLVMAIEKADDPTRKAALANLLLQEMDSQATNVIPFRMKDAADADTTTPPRYSRK